jgi:UDP-N-acetyl-D-mannosaminuronate dehydrogenase
MSWFKDKILKIKNDNNLKNIIFIGAAFKEDTDDLRDSPTLKIYDLLKEELNDVYIYDNLVNLPDGYKKVQKFADSSVLIEMYPLDNETFKNNMLKTNKLNDIFYFRFWEDSLNI